MRLLSFDTTNNCVSIALLERDHVVSERLFRASGVERQESVTLLLPAIDEMLQEVSWKKHDLDLLVVGIGPGSFTGIRIGVVTARTLAQALNLPLAGVSLFDAYAKKLQASTNELNDFAVVISGGRGHFYFAAYRVDEQGAVVEVAKPQHGTLAAMRDVIETNNTWAVEASILEVLRAELDAAKTKLVELPELGNIAAFQGSLGWSLVAHGKLAYANSLAYSNVSEENGRGTKEDVSRESLLEKYPYRLIEPLYLRGASVTLKGNDGKATATT